jgi:uncharacterized protein YqeY
MSIIENKIKDDLKKAMQLKDELSLSVLRMLISALRNKEIALRESDKVELSAEQVMEVISSEIKKRKDSISSFEQGGRQDLVEKEKKEIDFLVKYLPEQAGEEDIEKIVREIVANSEDNNYGKIMGQAMAKLKGKADGNKVGEMVKKVLQ